MSNLRLCSTLAIISLAIHAINAAWIYPCPTFGVSRIPHSTRCDRYVQCMSGVGVERECGPGLFYSENHQECVEYDSAYCERHVGPCPLYNDPDNMVYVNDETNCEKYYLCHHNQLQPFQCQSGFHYDISSKVCTHPALANCYAYNIDCPVWGTAQRPNPIDCSRYYICWDGEAFPSTCPDGLLFDVDLLMCRLPNDVTCSSGSWISTTTTTTTTEIPLLNVV